MKAFRNFDPDLSLLYHHFIQSYSVIHFQTLPVASAVYAKSEKSDHSKLPKYCESEGAIELTAGLLQLRNS